MCATRTGAAVTVRQAWVSTFGDEHHEWHWWLRQLGLDPRYVAAHEGFRDLPDCPPVVVDDDAHTVTLHLYRTTTNEQRFSDPHNSEQAAKRRIVITTDDDIAPFPATTGNRQVLLRQGTAEWSHIPPDPA